MTYEEYLSNSATYDEGVFLAFVILFIIGAIAAFIAWLITLYPRYYMIKASGVGPTWTAFIPIWQDIQLFKMAGFPWWSYWVYLIGFSIGYCIPVVNFFAAIGMFVFLCILYWRVSANFSLGTGGRILSLILGWWVYWYVALKQLPYINLYGNQQQIQYDNTNWYQKNTDNGWYQQSGEQSQQWYQTSNQQQDKNQRQ